MARDVEREIAAVREAAARVVRESETAREAARGAHASRLTALHHVAAALGAPMAPEPEAIATLFTKILQEATRALGGREAGLALAEDPAWRHLVPITREAGRNIVFSTFEPLHRRMLRAEGAAQHVLHTGERVMLPDMHVETPFGMYPQAQPRLMARGIRAAALVPLRTNGRVVGVLSI